MLSRSRLFAFAATPQALGINVCVGVKQVLDYTVKVRVKDNKYQIPPSAKMSVNPFDEIAVEEAVRLKEKKLVDEIYAITIGKKGAEPALRSALALGCTKAIHVMVPDNAEDPEPLAVAKIFAKLHAEIKPGLWILGKQAIDGDFGLTAQLLGGLLDIPQGTFASKVELRNDAVKVTREIDSGGQEIELKLPCIIGADLRLNTPRNAALPKIMAARKVKIDVRDIASVGVDVKPHLTYNSIVEPSSRKAGVMVKSVAELVGKLKNEAKVI